MSAILVIDNRRLPAPWGRPFPRRGFIRHNQETYGFTPCLAISRDSKRLAATLVGTSDLDHVDDETAFRGAVR